MSLYENPFTRRCTCVRFEGDGFTFTGVASECPVHGTPEFQRKQKQWAAERRAENLEKYRSVHIAKVRHS